jgi:hypothetical protein
MHRATTIAFCSLLLFACKKGDETRSPAEATGAQPTTPGVPQEPDPPEIAEGRKAYVLGEYQEVTTMLAPVYADLKEREQYRAGGLAGGWLALAHAKDVVENAEEPARHATAMAEKTGDPEVEAVAGLAHGAFLLGTYQFDAAAESFEKASALGTADAALAHILLAEALIGRAFGEGDSTKVQHPEHLDAAAKSYQRAAELAEASELADALVGRAAEGLAAVAKYQGKRDQICGHVKQATERYEAAGASDFLKEGPAMLGREARCK